MWGGGCGCWAVCGVVGVGVGLCVGWWVWVLPGSVCVCWAVCVGVWGGGCVG